MRGCVACIIGLIRPITAADSIARICLKPATGKSGQGGNRRTTEKGNFSPRHIKVPLGQKVKLRIRNVDTVMHGFAIPALDVDAGESKAGHNKILEFTPQKPGKYDFYCTTWCSEFHLQMRGILEVTAQ